QRRHGLGMDFPGVPDRAPAAVPGGYGRDRLVDEAPGARLTCRRRSPNLAPEAEHRQQKQGRAPMSSRNSMTNRRDFLLGAAAVTGAGLAYGLAGRVANAAQAQGGPVARKQIQVAGKNIKVIDIHGHLVIPKSGELLAGSNVKGDYPMAQIM